MPRTKKTVKRARVAPKKRKSVFSQSVLGRTYALTKSRTSVADGARKKVLLHGGANYLTLTAGSALQFFVGTGGSPSQSFDVAAQLAMAPKWATLAALFTEYRVTGVRMRFVPVTDFNGGTTIGEEPGVIMSWTPIAYIPTYNAVLDQEGSKIFNLHKDWSWFQSVSSVAGANAAVSQWDSTGLPTAGAFGFISAFLTNGTAVGAGTVPGFGTIAIDFVAEFRSMRT